MSETVTTTDKGTASTIIFFVITIIFFTAKYIFVDKKYSVDNLKYILGGDKKPSKKSALDAIMTVAYFAIIIIIQISINSQTILDKCKGYTQPIGVLFSTTIIPNVLILGLIYFVITLMPSWKYPFSYVFGMVSSKLRKSWESLRNIEEKETEPGKKMSLFMKVWTKAFGTESTKFIKKITKENFTEFFRKAFEKRGLLQKPGYKTIEVMEEISKNEDNIEYITALNDKARMKVLDIQDEKLFENAEKTYNSIKSIYQYVMRKDLIAQCIWFLLAGFLVMNVTQDTISSVECEYTAEQLREISNRQEAD